jgi:hypothetical protein
MTAATLSCALSTIFLWKWHLSLSVRNARQLLSTQKYIQRLQIAHGCIPAEHAGISVAGEDTGGVLASDGCPALDFEMPHSNAEF